MKYLFFLSFFTVHLVQGQIVDFENLDNIAPGDPIGKITLSESGCNMRFFYGYDLKDSIPLTLQQVAFDAGDGGFYGPELAIDCEGHTIPNTYKNQINMGKYALNPSITNRERIGCFFISGVLKGDVLPSIFIEYEAGTTSCSADLLDVDGHANTIEAYDIYCYAKPADYPLNPINTEPLKIRSLGRTTGTGILGDNGGVMPFKVEMESKFTILEIRPIQQVSEKNDVRHEFGFALDNFSPCGVENAPYTPPYLDQKNTEKVEIENLSPPLGFTIVLLEPDSNEVAIPTVEKTEIPSKIPTIDPIYFDYDSATLNSKAIQTLDSLILVQKKYPNQTLSMTGYCDPKGSETYNLALSKKRTQAVQNYLTKKGYPASKLELHYYGEAYNGDLNDPDWKKRVVFLKVGY